MRRYALILFLPLLVLSCSRNAKNEALSVSLKAITTAAEGFVAWDAKHQQELVEHENVVQARADWESYLKLQRKVLIGFQVALSALGAAALDPTPAALVEAAQEARDLFHLIKSVQHGEYAGEAP